ncbi:class I SAM-dependent methyltransferase [Hydrogenophaga sp. PAMC20947]|uniref:class I SAM-dependent methyltransferase n=1 Tax=Hydrogenophaga sp. PAMC20947 TaxID=2565558 RepID=UPI00109DBDC0|nr:class I SAM-dependent methyltransferase [Hydrogenophaga sp. PAMC20947]QCB46333.1 methyltransferase domain-containing protein [Hydrogenophaga sp. PAMC20947]
MTQPTQPSVTIHPDDDMFSGSLEHYESVGKQMAGHIQAASRLQNSTSAPRILELPCGYGRVTRHLVSMFPAEHICASDIMVPAVKFVTEQFGVMGHPAQAPFNELTGLSDNMFDVAGMGSLITHLSAFNSTTLLKHFFRVIKQGGIAVVTIHGVRSRQLLAERDVYEIGEVARQHLIEKFDKEQFGFVNYLPNHNFEAKTVEYIGDSYGISLIPNQWMQHIAEEHEMDLIEKIIGGWDNHQDVYYLKKR